MSREPIFILFPFCFLLFFIFLPFELEESLPFELFELFELFYPFELFEELSELFEELSESFDESLEEPFSILFLFFPSSEDDELYDSLLLFFVSFDDVYVSSPFFTEEES